MIITSRKLNTNVVLKELSSKPQRVTDIADRLGVPSGTAHYHLELLEKSGFAEKLNDKRWIATIPDAITAGYFDVEDNDVSVAEPNVIIEAIDEVIQEEPVLEVLIEPVVEPVVDTIVDEQIDYEEIFALNVPQTFARLAELYSQSAEISAQIATLNYHLAQLTMPVDASVVEQSPDQCFYEPVIGETEEVKCDCDEMNYDECVMADNYAGEVKVTEIPEVIEVTEVKQSRVSLKPDPIYISNDYKSLLGKLGSNHIFIKYSVVMFEKADFSVFTLSDVKLWFTAEYLREIVSMKKGAQGTKSENAESTVLNRAKQHISFMKQTGCLVKVGNSKKDGSKYQFVESPIVKFDIRIPGIVPPSCQNDNFLEIEFDV